MRRKSLSNTSCPIGRALDEIGDWWTLLIVREAFHGARRFRDFEQRLAISKNILTIRLNLLLEARIFEARPSAEGRTHKEYHLTHKGTRLWLVLVALRQWGEDHLFEDGETWGVLRDHSGRPVQRLQVLSADGAALAQPDTEVRFEVRGDAAAPSSSSTAV
ncbi:helix-turn-helix domain-containing protein [Paraburkholderia jirisanensis]